jgi:hypothetical protein
VLVEQAGGVRTALITPVSLQIRHYVKKPPPFERLSNALLGHR